MMDSGNIVKETNKHAQVRRGLPRNDHPLQTLAFIPTHGIQHLGELTWIFPK